MSSPCQVRFGSALTSENWRLCYFPNLETIKHQTIIFQTPFKAPHVAFQNAIRVAVAAGDQPCQANSQWLALLFGHVIGVVVAVI